jgi:hypothetical protein
MENKEAHCKNHYASETKPLLTDLASQRNEKVL